MPYPLAIGCNAAAEHTRCAHCGIGGLVAPLTFGIARAIDAVGVCADALARCDDAVGFCEDAVERCDGTVGVEVGGPFEDELDDGGADTRAAGESDGLDDPDWHPATAVATSSPASAYRPRP